MRNWGNVISPVSEANALREVDGFRAQGLAQDAGLGNVLFGHRYPGKGFPNTFEFKQNVTMIAVSTRTTRPTRLRLALVFRSNQIIHPLRCRPRQGAVSSRVAVNHVFDPKH